MTTLRRCLRSVLLVAVGLATTATAAETLQQAWDIALQSDYSLKAVQENTQAASQQLLAAKAARLPGLEVGAGYTARDNPPGVATVVNGQPASFPTGEKNNRNYNATVSLPIYSSGRISNSIKSASALLDASRKDELSHTLDLKLRVAEAFVGVLRANRDLEVADSHVTSLEAHMDDVQNRFDQGMAAQNDLLAAQVEFADARQEALQAANKVDLAAAGYNRLLGRPLMQAVNLQGVLPDPERQNFETLVALALQQRSELASLTHQILAMRREANGIRAQARPQLALSGGYDFLENPFQAHEGQWSVNLRLQWDVFDGGVRRHQAFAVERQAGSLQDQYDDMATSITLEVRQYWLDVQETRKRVQVTKDTIAQADENLKVNRDRYDNGLSTNAEVLDAETLRIRSLSNHTNAVNDAVLASLRLKRATGDL
ncbi:MAG: TolC family protein [Gammaproteobacteria bacterium]|nr:MAG: TolC family protein [Gammaproteobacteria bacterium]